MQCRKANQEFYFVFCVTRRCGRRCHLPFMLPAGSCPSCCAQPKLEPKPPSHLLVFAREKMAPFFAWPWRHRTAPQMPATRGVVPTPLAPTPTSHVAMTRDLGRAREAFAQRSVAASRAAHDGQGSSSSIATTSSSSITTSCSSTSEGSSRDLMANRAITIGAPDSASCAP